MKPVTVLFFGSFRHYSTIVLEALCQSKNIKVLGLVTAPPRPAGRHLQLTQTHTHLWAQQHNLPVFTPKTLGQLEIRSIRNLGRPNFFVVAGYRLLLPPAWLAYPTVAALNLHPSLLPQYPGPAPVEWAMLKGEKFTGISIIKMTEEYDQGPIIAQKKLPILPTDTRLTLYQKLSELGAEMVTELIENWHQEKDQKKDTPYLARSILSRVYARRLSRIDGFIPWPQAQAALTGGRNAAQVDRKIRALAGYPGVWTQVPKGHKRLKLLSLTQVQLEGKRPISVSSALLSELA
jgi:methionyl-tRNA formyltransferase